MYKRLLFVIFILNLSGCIDQPDIQWDIHQTMIQQATAWNNKDIVGFMEPYWHSDSMRFMGKSGVTKGWQSTLERYKKNYAPNQMGILSFDELHFDVLSSESAWVDGKWTLFRTSDTLSGRFSLLWKRLNGKWQIVADHSS